MATKTSQKVECPRCSGTGIYTGYGVCYRCHGKGTVNARKAPKAKPAIVETAEEQEARLRKSLGDADYEAIYGQGGYYS